MKQPPIPSFTVVRRLRLPRLHELKVRVSGSAFTYEFKHRGSWRGAKKKFASIASGFQSIAPCTGGNQDIGTDAATGSEL